MLDRRLTDFYAELKRRKVVRVAIVYAVVAWLLIEVASILFPGLLLPDWAVRLVIALAILGFPIAVVLAWAVDLTPDGIKAASETRDKSGATKAAAAPAKATADHRPSIAVLPLLNLSNDPDNEYFSDGMAEEILNLLCKLPQLKVASRTSSFSFKGKNLSLGSMAEQLGVDLVLEGSVRRAGDRVRITAQLIDTSSDRHLWSETYDRQLQDVFAVQNEIARNIVCALEIELTPAQERSIRKRVTTGDMDAYDFYLKGRFHFERGDERAALQMFERAIEHDPDFALGWAGLADSRAWMCMWREESPENLRAADRCSLKAVQLAPHLAGTHASRGFALALNHRYEEAQKAFDTAMGLDPQLFETYYFAGRSYFAQGKFRKAVDMFARAGDVRPEDVSAAVLEMTSLSSLGLRDEAVESARKARKVVEKHLELHPDDVFALARGANVMLKLGETEKAIEWAERGLAIDPDLCGYNVACVHAGAGNAERALDVLEEFAASNFLHRDWLDQDRDMDPLRDHPRFKALTQRLSGSPLAPG